MTEIHTTFDRTTQLRLEPLGSADGADRFAITLSEEWSSMFGAHGGYVTAVAVRAVQARLAQTGEQRVRTVCTNYFRPAATGDAVLSLRTLRSGRSLSTFEVTLEQGGRTATSTRITAGAPVAGTAWDHAAPLPVPSSTDCITVPGPPGVRHLDHAVGVLDPAHLPLTRSDLAVLQGHIRPAEARPIDEAWLVMVLDYFPPAAWTKVDPPAGGVSVDYTVHIHRTHDRALADDEWLAVQFRSDVSTGGLTLEHGSIAGPDGQLLAESFHTRWTG